jgi:hydrogenase/urease accessory protein HupE
VLTSPSIRNRSLICFFSILFLLISSYPVATFAHAYSSSFTEINFSDKRTEIIFSIDTLSIIELVEGIDENQNGVLEKSELKAEEHHIDELIHSSIVVDKDNQQQEPEIKSIEFEKKEDKEFLTFTFHYPAYFPGDTITFMDGFYANDSDTNYINLISAQNRGETSQAVLQGDNRNWTILLTEVQQEQGTTEGQDEVEDENESDATESAPHIETSNNGWVSFFKLGMFHILTGYDHLLFLLVLLLRKQTFKQYAAIVTSFTIAHSITLSLAVLGIVDLPSRFVEAMIAFSICYVAVENLFRNEIRYRWGLTFVFGLIHGLGFANLLKEISINKTQLASSLISFNIGIEVVQILIVLLFLPILSFIHKQSYAKKVYQYGSILIFILGAFWLIERIFL